MPVQQMNWANTTRHWPLRPVRRASRFGGAVTSGIRTYLASSIAHHRSAAQALAEERELQPRFASTLQYHDFPPAEVLRMDEEIELATARSSSRHSTSKRLSRAESKRVESSSPLPGRRGALPARGARARFALPRHLRRRVHERKGCPTCWNVLRSSVSRVWSCALSEGPPGR